MAERFNWSNTRRWMKLHLSEHIDPKTGEVNYTSLTEACAAAFERDYSGGPLDSSDHWLWDLAIIVGEERQEKEKERERSRSPHQG